MVRGDENPEGFYELIKDLGFNKRAWQGDARCRGLALDLFFPERGETTKKVKGICEPCKVKTECLDYAIENERFGIWGGMSEQERRGVRRKKELAKVAAGARHE